jgi:hypothetical protein
VEDKAGLLQPAFFPTPPPADLTDIANAEYPQPPPFPTIEKHETETTVRAAPADKAPGEDTIPNGLWHKAIQVPEPIDRIQYFFNARIAAGYNSAVIQRSVTVVLRKGGERDYREPRSYRPVALLNWLRQQL